jgi:hypothetical protein
MICIVMKPKLPHPLIIIPSNFILDLDKAGLDRNFQHDFSRNEIKNLCILVPLTAEGGRKGEEEVEEDGGGPSS